MTPKCKTRCVACGRKGAPFRYGRCRACFARAERLVKAGKTSWWFLERTGFALPPREVRDGR